MTVNYNDWWLVLVSWLLNSNVKKTSLANNLWKMIYLLLLKSTASRYCHLWTFPFELLFKVFKTRLLGKCFYTLIKNVLFSFLTDVGSHNPPLFGAQRPCWHSFPSPIDVRPPNPPPLGPNVLSDISSCVHPLWGIPIHPRLGLSVLADIRSLLQLMWDPPIHPPSGPNVLSDIWSCVHPLWSLASSLTHRPVFDYDTICNSTSPLLAHIVVFGLSLLGFPSRFLKRVC